MSHEVIDASVLGAAFFREPFAERAEELLASGTPLRVPDLIYAEVGNIIWKRHGRGEIDAVEAADLYDDVAKLPLIVTPCRDLTEAALQLALRTKRTVYDSLYLALAIAHGTRVVTGDKRLVNALKDGPLGKHVVWIGDV